ncbi:hypothetical protein AX17_001143 [Amanita inopinata Kibby_2008]|nr:hypothetical protein AX17_001143 [Amanita inopinata Kibby_2008]
MYHLATAQCLPGYPGINQFSPPLGYAFYEQDLLTYPRSPLEPSFSNDFQSNIALLRACAPVTTLTGLGIECPDLAIDQSLAQAPINTSSDLYAPFASVGTFSSFMDTLPKSNYQFPTSAEQKQLEVYDSWGMRALSPAILDIFVPPELSSVGEVQNPQERRYISNEEANDSRTLLSFHALSAASGLPPDILARHISATAEIALQLLSDQGADDPCSDLHGLDVVDRTQDHARAEQQLWSYPSLSTPDMALPFADVNMNNLKLLPSEMSAGVNPSETLPAYYLAPLLSSPPPLGFGQYCLPDVAFKDSSSNEAIRNDCLGYLNSTILAYAKNILCSPLTELTDDTIREQDKHRPEYEPSEYEPSLLGSGSEQDCSPFPSPGLRTLRRAGVRKSTKRDVIQYVPATSQSEGILFGGFPSECRIDSCKEDIPIDLGTPVTHAHLGITLSELQEKAERYRLRNHAAISRMGDMEVEYDKRWLLSFVGRLSPMGESIHEFRCYVAGCAQTNKRRDHILIHLGAHLGQRPFKCSEWYVLFRFS